MFLFPQHFDALLQSSCKQLSKSLVRFGSLVLRVCMLALLEIQNRRRNCRVVFVRHKTLLGIESFDPLIQTNSLSSLVLFVPSTSLPRAVTTIRPHMYIFSSLVRSMFNDVSCIIEATRISQGQTFSFSLMSLLDDFLFYAIHFQYCQPSMVRYSRRRRNFHLASNDVCRYISKYSRNLMFVRHAIFLRSI